LIAGLVLAAATVPAAMAQEGLTASPPLGVTGMPGAAADGGIPMGAMAPPVMPGAGYSVPAGSTDAVAPGPEGCTCGDRRGFARWRWHRRQCKRHLQEHFIGYPEEFNEWPLGQAAYAHARTQAANGLAARMVFYHYDFVDGTSELNLRGRDKLAKVATVLPRTFYPVVVERTPKEPGLDTSRRSMIVAALAKGSFPTPPERVVIGPSIANGMTGLEGLLIYGNQLQNLSSGGGIAGAGTSGFIGGGLGFTAGGLSGAASLGGIR
jgi:hypothetical protein